MTRFNQYGKGRTAAPCATCGTPSTSWFPDGSPSWPGHSHVETETNAPTIYYQDDLVTLYHGDCRAMQFDTWDVLLLDPPFDQWTNVPELDGRTVIAFTTHQHRPEVERRYGKPRTELVWVSDTGRWVSHNLPLIRHETILVYGETGESYVGDKTDGIPVRKGGGSVGRDTYATRTYVPRDRKALTSVMEYSRDLSAPLGVWQKPLGMISRLLEWSAGRGVLDPYAGSGTTLVAAKALGIRAVGVEIDERHCEIAANRCRQETLGLYA
jgi:hypothetical protein